MLQYNIYVKLYESGKYQEIIDKVFSTEFISNDISNNILNNNFYYLYTSYKALKDQKSYLDYLKKAYNTNIVDSYYEYALLYMEKGDNNVSYKYCKEGLGLLETQKSLNPNLKCLFLYILSIVSYYVSNNAKIGGYKIISDLMIQELPNNLKYIRYNTLKNCKHYIQPLNMSNNKQIAVNFKNISSKISDHEWKPLNPSIVNIGNNRYIMSIRTVNYTQDNNIYKIYDPQQVIISETHLIAYEQIQNNEEKGFNKFNILGRLQISNNYKRIYNPTHIGIEDARLFIYPTNNDKELLFSCTTPDTNNNGKPEISIGNLGSIEKLWKKILDINIPSIKVNIKPVKILDTSYKVKVEKNWMPYIKDGKIRFIYSHKPLTTLEIVGEDLCNYKAKTIESININYNLSKFHGSAGPLKYNDGYLSIIHEIDNHRNYFHRFIYYDQNMIPLQISKPFYFKYHNIEFCAGMCYEGDSTLGTAEKEIPSNNIILTYGAKDREAYQCTMSIEKINNLLENLEDVKFEKIIDNTKSIIPKINTTTTIVSIYIDLSKYEHRRKTSDHYKKCCIEFLKLPYTMVLFLDDTFYDMAMDIRKKAGMEKYTKIIKIGMKNLDKYKYLDRLQNNYDKSSYYSPTGIAPYNKDKDTPHYMILNNSKYGAVIEAIKMDPFKSILGHEITQYAWVDFGILGCIKTFDGLNEALNYKSSKLSIPYIIPKLIHREPHKYFGSNWYYACSGFMYGSVTAWFDFKENFDILFDRIIKDGFYGNEEAFLGFLLVEKTNLFEPYYADYYSMFINRFCVKADVQVALKSVAETGHSDLQKFQKLTINNLISGFNEGHINLDKKTINELICILNKN